MDPAGADRRSAVAAPGASDRPTGAITPPGPPPRTSGARPPLVGEPQAPRRHRLDQRAEVLVLDAPLRHGEPGPIAAKRHRLVLPIALSPLVAWGEDDREGGGVASEVGPWGREFPRADPLFDVLASDRVG